MPDQSTAATEHAILQEITGPLQRLPEDPVAQVHADFPTTLRGYDRLAVDAYVQQVTQLVAELHASRSPESAVRRALERVGEQISGILQRAHETAEQITAQSRGEAEDRLQAARAEAAEIVATAQQHVRDLDADTDRIWIERGRIVDDARDLARELLSVVETAADRFPEPEPEPEPVSEAEAEAADARARAGARARSVGARRWPGRGRRARDPDLRRHRSDRPLRAAHAGSGGGRGRARSRARRRGAPRPRDARVDPAGLRGRSPPSARLIAATVG